jgi:ATP-dependent DNA helicase DinG
MAARVEAALADHARLVVESGTGTGKTFAYLVAVLRSGKKVLISTGTKNLQDQLYRKDLPLVREALALPVTTALLKGRANYLCRHRFERAHAEGHRGHAARELTRLYSWTRETASGDLAEDGALAEDSELWPLVTSTAENCLGGQCDQYDDCFVNHARREALAADVVVVNHHLFFADLALKEEGFGQLLPGVEAVIFDEAHQLPDTASLFFGVRVSAHQLVSLARDAVTEELKEASGIAELRPAAQALEKAVADFRLSFGINPRREAWSAIAKDQAVQAGLNELTQQLAGLGRVLQAAAARGQGLANCAARAQALSEQLSFVAQGDTSEYVAWFETTTRGFALNLTPLDIANSLRPHLAANKAWVFTSATLAMHGRFDHFLAQLGLEDADTACFDSPFDYAAQSLLYLPPGLPDPAQPDFTEAVVNTALPVLAASQGRAFLLFTSHRALRRAAELLHERLPYPLLVQGSASRTALLERFRALGNAVLLGTGSFWEGVDVRGEALSCVIIDKLPFAAPDDPVLRARAQALEDEGRNAFVEVQLPQAVIALKQGAGRLIRDEHDHGVLVLCDPRLTRKSYGRVFLASLPPMPRTQQLGEVEAFFAHRALAPAAAS